MLRHLVRGVIALAMGYAGLACGGGKDIHVDPLPVGAGLFITESNEILDGDALFWQVDELTGARIFSDFPGDNSPTCKWLAAMDTRPDGVVLGVGGENANVYRVDPRPPTRCVKLHKLPAVMRTVAVRSDGHVFTTDDTTLYELDAGMQVLSTVAINCPLGACIIGGLDFAPNGDLHAITTNQDWGTIDPTTGIFSGNAQIGVRDDFDIDDSGNLRAMTGDEYRMFDLSGVQQSAVSLQDGTTFITGVVFR